MRIAKFIATFFLSCALTAVGAAAIAVYVIGAVDPKFRDSLSSAFHLELITAAGLTLIGTILIAIACTFLHRQVVANRKALWISFAWGVAYPVLLHVALAPAIATLDPESLVVSAIGWAYLIAFPLLISIPLHNGRSNAGDHANAL
jgi:hypothetical protein